jgi:hypothetical protein
MPYKKDTLRVLCYARGAYIAFHEATRAIEAGEDKHREQAYLSGKLDALLDLGVLSRDAHNRIKRETWAFRKAAQ